VVDNLKEYGVRALVNVVDHLGTVAYKLTDLYEQQSSDIATVEQKISCLCQVKIQLVVRWQDPLEGAKTVSGFESSDDSGQREICQPPARNKSILSALFPRNKTTFKPKRLVVS
ncbi:hypothetical protein GW17_00001785, partial [Ensete ventricosum]